MAEITAKLKISGYFHHGAMKFRCRSRLDDTELTTCRKVLPPSPPPFQTLSFLLAPLIPLNRSAGIR